MVPVFCGCDGTVLLPVVLNHGTICIINATERMAKEEAECLHEDPKWYAYITTDLMNIRTWAGKEYGTVSFSPLPFRTKLGICDEVKAANGDKWYYILYKGKHGFVSAKYISKKKPKKVVSS